MYVVVSWYKNETQHKNVEILMIVNRCIIECNQSSRSKFFKFFMNQYIPIAFSGMNIYNCVYIHKSLRCNGTKWNSTWYKKSVYTNLKMFKDQEAPKK